MCRWVAYLGQPVFMEDFVSVPCQSLVAQSRRCREAKSEINADGFGLGWYGEREFPGVFRDIRPAWSDENLKSLAHQIRSRLFLAHVRASTGTQTTRANCHPFTVGRWLFMHNGQIGGFERLRRRIDLLLPEALYLQREGTTDSEALFLLMLGNGLADDPLGAVQRSLQAVEAEMRVAGETEPLRFTSAFSDGRALYAVRYASDLAPPTLYTREIAATGGILVASEPLDDGREGWIGVPAQSSVTVTADAGVVVAPFSTETAPAAAAAAKSVHTVHDLVG